jgi:small-conductance mechanosensitive channel
MPEHPIQNLNDLLQSWRVDALQFLRIRVPKILVILAVAIFLGWLLRTLTRRLQASAEEGGLPGGMRRQQFHTLSGVIYSGGLFVIVFQALLQVLAVLDINMGPLLASAGVAGLAIGFGAQTLVRDVINGFFILMENQYEVGDAVRIGAITGTVEKMTLRTTVLRDEQGALSTIPNGKIDVVSNLTRDWAQVALHIAVAYTESSDRVMELLKEIAAELRNDPQWKDVLVGDPQVPGIDRVIGNEVDYLMLVKTRPGMQYSVTRELRRRIKEHLEKNQIQPGGAGRTFVAEIAMKPPGVSG